MSACEERAALMGMAGQLQTELRQINKQIGAVIAKLVEAGDSLLIPSAEERQENPKIKMIVYGKAQGTSSLVPGKPHPEDDPVQLGPALTDLPRLGGKRACSICRKSGHRAQNCPDADKAYKAERAKKPRKPMSPERREQAAKNLAKARAARRKK